MSIFHFLPALTNRLTGAVSLGRYTVRPLECVRPLQIANAVHFMDNSQSNVLGTTDRADTHKCERTRNTTLSSTLVVCRNTVHCTSGLFLSHVHFIKPNSLCLWHTLSFILNYNDRHLLDYLLKYNLAIQFYKARPTILAFRLVI